MREANAKDDAALAKDADGDGVIDGDQLKASELANRKIFIMLGAIKQPDRLQAAIGSLWAAYIAVLATLKLEFARTTAFALGIVEVVKLPVVRILSPLVVTVLMAAPADVRLAPEATKGWSVTIIESTLTLVAVIFAWVCTRARKPATRARKPATTSMRAPRRPTVSPRHRLPCALSYSLTHPIVLSLVRPRMCVCVAVPPALLESSISR